MNYSPLEAELASRLSAALGRAFGEEYSSQDPLIRSSQFSDVQSNVALSLAKPLRMAPREIAQRIADNFFAEGFTAPVEVNERGFLNFTVEDSWLSETLVKLSKDKYTANASRENFRVIIDYSSPNVAKEMHVGHLRTTVVGDALARVLEATGAQVVRQNHIGDWGTPFGMLIELLLAVGEDSPTAELLASEPNSFYQLARKKFDESPDFAKASRERVVLLQRGDEETLALWGKIIARSREYFNGIYAELGVSLTDDDLAGESSYNEQLATLCEELLALGIAEYSQGALVVFFPEYPGRDGEPGVLVIRKSDGGYGYAATDLAALRHRVAQLQADRLVYVVGAPQELHLTMVKIIAQRAGWLPESVKFDHVMIGNVLGSDGKMLKTRSGEPVLLKTLLNDAVKSERELLASNGFVGDELEQVSRAVGIGAVKYADLSVSHETEYTFDVNRMLALQGNTGPYLQYAAVRIRSIFRKLDISRESIGFDALTFTTGKEKELALKLLSFGAIVHEVSDSTAIHSLCLYLFTLSQTFNSFYEQCPIASAAEPEKLTRLALAKLTLEIIEGGLQLLGLETPEAM